MISYNRETESNVKKVLVFEILFYFILIDDFNIFKHIHTYISIYLSIYLSIATYFYLFCFRKNERNSQSNYFTKSCSNDLKF